jgi:hypothetical protein
MSIAVRAIGAEFARQLWFSSFILALITSSLLVVLLIWLTSLSAWWWLLALPIGIALSVAGALLIVFRLLINYVRPTQTSAQKKSVKSFVGQLQFVSEFTSTPKFLILFRVIRSIAAPKSDSYLQDIFETKNLKRDFQSITKTFKGE